MKDASRALDLEVIGAHFIVGLRIVSKRPLDVGSSVAAVDSARARIGRDSRYAQWRRVEIAVVDALVYHPRIDVDLLGEPCCLGCLHPLGLRGALYKRRVDCLRRWVAGIDCGRNSGKASVGDAIDGDRSWSGGAFDCFVGGGLRGGWRFWFFCAASGFGLGNRRGRCRPVFGIGLVAGCCNGIGGSCGRGTRS